MAIHFVKMKNRQTYNDVTSRKRFVRLTCYWNFHKLQNNQQTFLKMFCVGYPIIICIHSILLVFLCVQVILQSKTDTITHKSGKCKNFRWFQLCLAMRCYNSTFQTDIVKYHWPCINLHMLWCIALG